MSRYLSIDKRRQDHIEEFAEDVYHHWIITSPRMSFSRLLPDGTALSFDSWYRMSLNLSRVCLAATAPESDNHAKIHTDHQEPASQNQTAR